MTQQITRSYDDYEDARNVALRLEQAGIAPDDISLVGRQQTGDSSTAAGAGIGGAVGGVAGLLAGMGAVAIPGLGPVIAIGWLASTITGAAAGALAGGLIGALTGAGVEEREAHFYAETVRRGASVVSVRVAEGLAETARSIMDAAGPIDAQTRRAEYEREGWDGFEPRASGDTPTAP